jgi:3-methyladenine DNA glycosylase AlkD
MLHSAKGRLSAPSSPAQAARDARRELARLARPAGEFDARRYFRAAADLRFHNTGTDSVRRLARTIHLVHRETWSVDEALAFADALIADEYLEAKAVGIELLARYKRDFAPRHLAQWKRWLTANHAANWATTDAICGALIGPLVLRYAELGARLRVWSRHRNMWVRRASIVGLIPRARRGESLDLVYEIAARLHADGEDLVQKAVGWALREAGKTDMPRLERYLRANGALIPRTTVRYAIERFPARRRAKLLASTRSKE